MTKIQSKEDFLAFKTKYEKVSGLHLPMEYLESSDVYVFRKDNQLVGGFILGSASPLRTVNLFVSEENRETVSNHFLENKYCEICCFWIDRKYRKSAVFNAFFWLRMAYTVKRQEKEFVLFGTNSKGFAKMYGYPKKSLLFHKDKISGRETFVFLGRSKDIVSGVLEIVFSKIFKRKRNRNIDKKEVLKETLIYEISK